MTGRCAAADNGIRRKAIELQEPRSYFQHFFRSFRRFKTESNAHRSPSVGGRVHLLVGLSLNSIPSGKSGPTGMNCSSMRFSLERGRLSTRARASATSLQFSMKMTPRPSPRVNHC